jgi:hypothetical protein
VETLVSRATSSLITHDRRFLAVWQEIVVKFYLPPQPCKSSKIASKSAKSVFDFLRLAGELVENFGNVINGMLPLMKWYVTAYGNGMLPLYATQVSYPRQYATTLGNRLWKWYVTDCLVTYPDMQPLIEMVGNRFMQPK